MSLEFRSEHPSNAEELHPSNWEESSPHNISTNCAQARIDVLVSAVDLIDVRNFALALCGKRCDQQRDPGAEIGGGHVDAAQLWFAIQPDDGGTVGVTQDDLGSHVDEFVDEEQAALKHFLVNQHRTLGLGSGDQHNAE